MSVRNPATVLPSHDFGNGADGDIEVSSSVTWTDKTGQYENITVANGGTLGAPSTRYGPLIIRCNGLLHVEAGGKIDGSAKGQIWDGTQWHDTRVGNGHISNLSGYGDVTDYIELIFAPQWPIPGGGGGGQGGGNAGSKCELSFDANNTLYVPGIAQATEASGGAAGSNGQDGSAAIADADRVKMDVTPERPAIGCQGGAGGAAVVGPVGGRGGTAIIIFAKTVIVDASGTIEANGGVGTDASANNEGGGGGGGGGSILIVTESYTNNGDVEANGGGGGAGNGTGGDGGNGQDGIIRIWRP